MGREKKHLKIKYMNGNFPEHFGELLDNADDREMMTLVALLMSADKDGILPVDLKLSEVLSLDESEITSAVNFWRGAGILEYSKKEATSTENISDKKTTYAHAHKSGAVEKTVGVVEYLTGELADILETPNNILGVEYCKALLKLKSKIIPHTLKRQGQDYHSETADEGFASATGIRKLLGEQGPEQETILKAQLPPATYDCLSPYFGHRPLTEDDLSMLLRYKLITENRSHLTEYFGVNKELSNRIYKHLSDFETFSSFAELLKTKNITRTAINRALLHILLDIKAADVQEVTKRGCVDYIRVLGFRKEAAGLLKEFSDIPETPLITNLSAAPVLCEIDIRADQIYQMCASQTYKIPYQNEYQRKMLVV